MLQKSLFILFIFLSGYLKAQVGINTTTPYTTLDVVKEPSGTVADGIIAPNLSLTELQARDGLYGTSQTGAFVYVTAIDATPTGKTINVITTGYYYFDGTKWMHFNNKLQTADNGLSVTSSAKVQLGGDLIQNTQIDTKNYDLTFTGTGNVGIGTATPSVKLDINSGGTITTPVSGFKLVDGNEEVGKILTSDSQGIGTWKKPGNSTIILGDIPASSITRQVTNDVSYSGMSITLPRGSFQVNFTVWCAPVGDRADNSVTTPDRFASVFFSTSPTSLVAPNYLFPIKSIIIPKAHTLGPVAHDYYGSGAIPIKVENTTTIYIWFFFSSTNYAGSDRRMISYNLSPGTYGPYVQLYAIPFFLD